MSMIITNYNGALNAVQSFRFKVGDVVLVKNPYYEHIYHISDIDPLQDRVTLLDDNGGNWDLPMLILMTDFDKWEDAVISIACALCNKAINYPFSDCLNCMYEKTVHVPKCNHVYKYYQGLMEHYEYCTKCDVKKGA